jgi:hypothetical protein
MVPDPTTGHRHVTPLELPTTGGPWSFRRFADQRDAHAFFARLRPGHQPPFLLPCDHLAPDGRVIPAGTWIVIYRPIITDNEATRTGRPAAESPEE